MGNLSSSKIIDDGFTLEIEVENFFQQNGWNTEHGRYVDIIKKIPREYDLIAWKEFKEFEFTLCLYISCKVLKDKFLFYFQTKEEKKILETIADNSAIYIKKGDERIFKGINKGSGILTHHYFINDKITERWSAVGNKDQIFDSVMQSINPLIYSKEKKLIEAINQPIIGLPITILNSFENLVERSLKDGKSTEKVIDNNFQFGIQYNYPSLNDAERHFNKYFVVDIVEFSRLTEFMQLINADAEIIKIITEDQILERKYNERRYQRENEKRDDNPFEYF